MAERDPVLGEPHLQGAHQRPRRVLDQMREPVVRHRFAPVAQDRLRAGGARLMAGRPDG